MVILRLFLAAAAAGLAAAILWAMAEDGRGLLAVLTAMTSDPWTVVTLADLYLGFMISAAIIFFTERRLGVALVFALPVFVLGNVWTAIWLVLRAPDIARRLRRD